MANNQPGGRRPPPPTPPFHNVIDRALQDSGLPDPTKDQFRKFAKILKNYLLQSGHAFYNGIPAPHGHEDDDDGGSLSGGSELLAWLAFQRAGEHHR